MKGSKVRATYTAAEMREEILYESYQLFAMYGIKRVHMKDLAKKMGISRTTLYNNFSSKRELVKGVIGIQKNRAKQTISGLEDESVSFNDKIKMLLDAKLSVLEEMGYAFLSEILNDKEYRSHIQEIQDEISVKFREFLIKEQSKGNITGDYDAEFISIYFQSLEHQLQDSRLVELTPSLASLTMDLINIALRGICINAEQQ